MEDVEIATLPEPAQAYIKSLRKESGDYRVANKNLTTELTALKTTGQTEAEKERERVADLQKTVGELTSKTIASEKSAALSNAGATKTALLVSQIDDSIVSDSKKLGERIKELKTEYPELFGDTGGTGEPKPRKKANAGDGGGGSGDDSGEGEGDDMNVVLRKALNAKRGGGEMFAVKRT